MSDVSLEQSGPPTARARSPREDLEKEAFSELDAISLREILDQDSRPTFVLDLDSDHVHPSGSKDHVQPIFCNAALRLHDSLLDSVTGAAIDGTPPGDLNATIYEKFRSWATSVSKFDDSKDVFPLTLFCWGMLWTGSTIRKRFRVISGNQCYDSSHLPKGDLASAIAGELTLAERYVSNKAAKVALDTTPACPQPPRTNTSEIASAGQSKGTGQTTLVESIRTKVTREQSSNKTLDGKSNNTSGSSSSITMASPEQDVPDWTAQHPKGVLSEHVRFARNVDWAGTPLGPMKSWSPQFCEIANLVMRNPHPAALFWGEELTMLYNEAYKNEVAGNKHPGLMGTGFSGPFSEIWDGVGPLFRECARTGRSVRKENDYLPIHRYGYLEETFFSWSVTPLYAGTGRIMGFYNAPFETTYQTINSRRMQTLHVLGKQLAQARSAKHFWKCVLEGLEDNPYDIPFALVYSITDSDDADTASHSSDSTISLKSCHLEGSIGIPEGHPASPPRLDLKRSQEGFVPAFREAMRTREPTTLHTRDGSLPENLLEGIEWRGFGDPCKEAIIIPVRPTNGENIFAFLLIGINPRRAYDEDYRAFSSLLNRQLATSLASFLLYEDEVRRSKSAAEAAALQREHLTQQLELQTSRMRRMTELSPLGMYLYSPDGILLEANDRFYEMTGMDRNNTEEQFPFVELMVDSSKEAVMNLWKKLETELKPCTEELQLKNSSMQPRDVTGEPMEYWIMATSMPEVGIDGKLKSIMGSITDISHMKWAQGMQERRLREAEETKRQQNEFIDITSHEMRNPLSAILICADDIRDTLNRHQFAGGEAAVVAECIEAANNIALCVQHQKSIVDDILTVSKLDSNLLLITPVPVQPVAVIQRAMSMFKPEVQTKDIQFDFVPHDSLRRCNIDWVNLDPSRLLQITVNLITNAIKFTQASDKRIISVHIGASANLPDLQSKGFDYVPVRTSFTHITDGEEWGKGDLVYIRVEVQDTGCGLTVEEKNVLFERFAQASPRTHAYYGGSGLGLFISRQLAELHGGQIGVLSEAGVGSTFGFFIRARRVDSPPSTLAPAFSRASSANTTPSNPASPPPALITVPIPMIPSASPSNTSTPSPHGQLAIPTGPPTPAPISTENENVLHILVVEDNLVNQRVLAKQLRKANCVVHTADNGVHALSFLATTTFQESSSNTPLDVILMDLEMPEMDGLTCVARIREMESSKKIKGHVPVIAVTANVRGEQIATAKNSGMDDVVSKPFRVPELLIKIRGLLERLGEQGQEQ